MKEGNAYTNILKLMKQQGYNKDVDIVIGVIISTSPLKISLGSFIIEEDDFYKTNSFVSSGYINDDRVLILIDNNDFFIIDKVV